MKIEIPMWTTHYNQLLYSLLIYSESKQLDLEITLNNEIPINGAILNFNSKRIFFDYSDATELIDMSSKYDYYFKRSLSLQDVNIAKNVFPLNFQVNFSYSPFKLISKMQFGILKNKGSFVELIRAIDTFGILTNDSHYSINIDKFKRESKSKGKVIFMTRLWDPARNEDSEEKERRRIQNDFRINACRTIKREFPDAIVGIYPDDFAIKIANDVLLDLNSTKKKYYLDSLSQCDIAIADDGLKDTSGWKIGEYIMCGKAVISTPINVMIEDFRENINYLSTTSRDNYLELPDLIHKLLNSDFYREIRYNNAVWYEKHLSPVSYISNIIAKTEDKIVCKSIDSFD
jgi:glycosyltransferase involved in cell wall biosynthesis